MWVSSAIFSLYYIHFKHIPNILYSKHVISDLKMNTDVIDGKKIENFHKEIEKETNNSDDLPFRYSQLFVPYSKFMTRENLIKKLRKEGSKERIKKYNEQFKAILKLELFL